MSEDGLKLTTYFGERGRVQGRLLADVLLDIHARHEIRSSILLRGVQGFGHKHRLRTDRLLTLSEDLPLVLEAVDVRERIEMLLEDASAIGHEGLVTLEPVHIGGIDFGTSHGASAHLQAREMKPVDITSPPGEAIKLTIYLGRYERANGSPAFATVCGTLHECGVAGATVLLGVDGTRHGERQRARFFARNADVPLMIMSIGEPKRIQSALLRVIDLLPQSLFTVERVQVCKRDGVLLRPPRDQRPAECPDGEVRQKLTIVTSEAARHDKRPVYLELVRRLRMADAAGATSLRGIWGFHGEHNPHGDRLLAIRRHTPVVSIAIDTPERIDALFPIVDQLTSERGLVTSELIPASSAIHVPSGL